MASVQKVRGGTVLYASVGRRDWDQWVGESKKAARGTRETKRGGVAKKRNKNFGSEKGSRHRSG